MAKKTTESKTPAKVPSKTAAVKKAPAKKTPKDANQTAEVDAWMKTFNGPMKAEIEAVRSIIKDANSKIHERVKWNAPSFFYKEDMVTFHPRPADHVHLVFHHSAIVTIDSPLLEGDYKDRRMMYFKDMKEIEKHRKTLQRIMNELVNIVDR
jgi:hypothetical protein